jgi:hypothetical protein
MPTMPTASNDDHAWTGHWRVMRYGGAAPDVPTYYVATPQSFDVVKDTPGGLHVARHPILAVEPGDAGDTLRLKDEGAPDADAERWTAVVRDGQLRVTARTGPHAGAEGLARPTDTDPLALGD